MRLAGSNAPPIIGIVTTPPLTVAPPTPVSVSPLLVVRLRNAGSSVTTAVPEFSGSSRATISIETFAKVPAEKPPPTALESARAPPELSFSVAFVSLPSA